MPNIRVFILTITLFVLLGPFATGQSYSWTRIKEYEADRKTYPFSDPNPIANPSIYPYFRFDTYAVRPTQRKWKVIELENAFLKLAIYPEIGGKIWSATVKSTGESLLFDNPVVKFRDVAMRGPWTSGGMEFNFGMVGHSPHCSSPVDYLVRNHPDGSASCFLSHLDLMTRSVWTVEINLPADSAGFVTRVYWHNGTPFHQPYYSWSNLGVAVSDKWQAVNPGTAALGHNGERSPWPIDGKGNDLTWYRNNNFGSYKSYHVFGKLAEHYGYYDHGRKSGMAAYVPSEDRRGRKVWIWGLSREGMIWEKLLTDPPGKQYLEIQAGRLLIQNSPGSSATPFKHRDFEPFAVDCWEEHWLPVGAIGGFVTASPMGSMNVETLSLPGDEPGKQLQIAISSAKPYQGKLEVLDGETLLKSISLSLRPLQTFRTTVRLDKPAEKLVVRFDNGSLEYERDEDNTLTRPSAAPESFDETTAFAQYLNACEAMRQKQYAKAKRLFDETLKQEPHFVPALTRLAELANMQGDWQEACELCRRALAVDTYDADANHQFALASLALGHFSDAREAASVMSLSPGHRALALTMQARVELVRKKYDSALRLADKARDFAGPAAEPLRILACTQRIAGQNDAAKKTVEIMKRLNPLDHFADAELFLLGQEMPKGLPNLQTELPHETYLELAAWYCSVGRDADATAVLELSASQPGKVHIETQFWLAWLHRDVQRLAKAKSLPPAFVFPFRLEALPVFEWAADQNAPDLPENDWKANYYLALLLRHLGKTERAGQLLRDCGNKPDFAAFYAVRADWFPETAFDDIMQAVTLEPRGWRYGVRLARLYQEQGEYAKMMVTTSNYLAQFPANDLLKLLHAQALVENRQYGEAVRFLRQATLLPNEGGLAGRNVYREATLLSAAKCLRENNPSAAKRWILTARLWPENLGSGKPYPAEVDERIENWLDSLCANFPDPLPEWEDVLKITGHSHSALVQKILTELRRVRSSSPESHVSESDVPEWDEPLVEWDEPLPESEEPLPESEEPLVEWDEPLPEWEEPLVEWDEPLPESEEPLAEPDISESEVQDQESGTQERQPEMQ
ncbi:MAG: DUF5107 domain-containing protein [Planctomycetaceae bacterium]|nr:DUF5107 domain-containing protein [Planctomycetaceae bacterium]